MSSDFMPGGRRRIDRVLDPAFLDGLDNQPIEEIRSRRHEADQEEADVSYARRLIQGRIDILHAEQKMRVGHGHVAGGQRTDAELAKALAAILADDRRDDHGLGRHATITPSRVGEHRREAEAAVADLGPSDPTDLSDDALSHAVDRLAGIEQRLSRTRHEVQQVVDALNLEVGRRYQPGPEGMAHV